MEPTELEDLQEIQHWLKANADTLRKYAPDELAFMARLVGFDALSIYKAIPTAYNDHQARCDSTIREWWLIERELAYIEQSRGKPSLSAQWASLYDYMNGEDWDIQ